MYKTIFKNTSQFERKLPFDDGGYMILMPGETRTLYTDAAGDMYAPFCEVTVNPRGEIFVVEREDFQLPKNIGDVLGKKWPIWFYNISGSPVESIALSVDFTIHIFRGIPKLSYISIVYDFVRYESYHIRPVKRLRRTNLRGNYYSEIWETKKFGVERSKKEIDAINEQRKKHGHPQLKKQQKKPPKIDEPPPQPEESDMVYNKFNYTWTKKSMFLPKTVGRFGKAK